MPWDRLFAEVRSQMAHLWTCDACVANLISVQPSETFHAGTTTRRLDVTVTVTCPHTAGQFRTEVTL